VDLGNGRGSAEGLPTRRREERRGGRVLYRGSRFRRSKGKTALEAAKLDYAYVAGFDGGVRMARIK